MLTIHTSRGSAPLAWQPGSELPEDAVWLELFDPGEAERTAAASVLGAPIPTREQISGIELSSRVRAQGDALFLNIPSFVRGDAGEGAVTPLGFVLTPRVLVSQRYAASQAFDLLNARAAEGKGPQSAGDAFFHLLDTFVDVGADRMEHVAAELSQLSRRIFTAQSERTGHKRMLRASLFQLGRMQRTITQVRAAMLGLLRVIDYMRDAPVAWIPQERYAHLATVHADLQSLGEFDQQVSDKVQFLLDAVLGFISIAQNDVLTVLTVVSVVTIPPMILAGIWGMNFKSIHEYDWPYGYAFAWSMIVLSMLVPLAIFRIKKWI